MPEEPPALSPPEGLPDEAADSLGGLTPEQLRNAIIFARELLYASDESESPIEPAAGEDILRVTERDGYTEVVKQVQCGERCEDCPHGPYLYHVTDEPHPDGTTHAHWSFLGRVETSEE
ncbi:MAG: hypothetical protein ABEH83_04785 [Halobacterium sp.]